MSGWAVSHGLHRLDRATHTPECIGREGERKAGEGHLRTAHVVLAALGARGTGLDTRAMEGRRPIGDESHPYKRVAYNVNKIVATIPQNNDNGCRTMPTKTNSRPLS